LTSLSDVRTSTSALGRALGYGNIRLISSSGVAGEDTFTTVRNVDVFKRQILEQKAGALPMPAANGATGTIPTQHAISQASAVEITELLDRLAKLRDSGAITPEEYSAKKADLLARL
jgi:hypothetical protein